ncbi:STAS domain-containing protein [Streptomyces sp. NPDC004129]|uniref:STAS domain-containing protein n=1 Tax=Streptomyces sp. NPDC004533 TaxID=3154278 RepID=UPI0033BC2F2E
MKVIAQSDDRILRITRTVDPPGLRLDGELDATRHSDVSDALSSLVDEGSEVRLDLTRLSFIDLGALSLLTSFVERRGGRIRLIMDNLAPQLEKLIETVGWERLPGLVQGRKGVS